MRLTNRPQIALAVVITLGATGLIFGLAYAQSGPPGPGWRDITPESAWKRWKEGTDRQGQARKARERRSPK
jgi:hypothetical protein